MVNAPTAGVDYHVSFGGRKGSSYGPREQARAAREFYTVRQDHLYECRVRRMRLSCRGGADSRLTGNAERTIGLGQIAMAANGFAWARTGAGSQRPEMVTTPEMVATT